MRELLNEGEQLSSCQGVPLGEKKGPRGGRESQADNSGRNEIREGGKYRFSFGGGVWKDLEAATAMERGLGWGVSRSSTFLAFPLRPLERDYDEFTGHLFLESYTFVGWKKGVRSLLDWEQRGTFSAEDQKKKKVEP